MQTIVFDWHIFLICLFGASNNAFAQKWLPGHFTGDVKAMWKPA